MLQKMVKPPIFVDADHMSFADARGILMGNESSATNYLQNKIYSSIRKFNPNKKIHLQKCW
jgi:hypothetical protein